MFEDEKIYDKEPIPWREYLSILYRGRWVTIITFLLFFSLATYYILTMKSVYMSGTTIQIRRNANMYNKSVAGFFDEGDRNITNHLQLIKSRTIAKMVLDRINNYENAKYISMSKENSSALSKNTRLSMIRNKIIAVPIKNTDIIRISVEANSSLEAKFLANTVAEQYVIYSSEENRGELGAVSQFLSNQLQQVKEKLRDSEKELQKFKKSENLVSLSKESQTLIEEVSQFQAKYNASKASLDAIDQKIKYLSDQLDEKNKKIVDNISSNTSPIIEGYNRSISKAYTRIAELEADRKPGSERLIKRLKEQIVLYKDEIAKQAKVLVSTKSGDINPLKSKSDLMDKILNANSEKISKAAEAAALKKIVAVYNAKMEDIPEKSISLARLERDFRINEQTYIMMQNKYEETKISEAGQIGNVRIVDRGVASPYPIKPNRPLYLIIAGLISLGFGILLSFLMSYIDSSIKTIEEIERLPYPFLGAIPTINFDDGKINRKLDSMQLTSEQKRFVRSKLITHYAPKSPVSEAYRSIRTNIQFSSIDNPPKVLALTSSVPREGKSTTISNLSVALSQLGKKVLLVDADLRKPVIHKQFNILRENGLTDFLLGKQKFTDIVKKSGIPNLEIISCGVIPHNPSEILGSERMNKFIEQAKENYDYVFFDTPPAMTVTDAAVLSRKIDGIIVLLSSGKVGRVDIIRVMRHLQSVKANLIGLVLNNLNIKKLYGSYYYYYRYYNNYYYYGSENIRVKSKNRKRE